MSNNNVENISSHTRGKRRSTSDVTILALGGLGEIGKNMYCIQYEDEMVVVDAGIKFPGSDMPGVDYIIPNISYLIERKEMVKGIFLTHGHEDHIGGLPFVLRQLQVPVYGAALTIGFVREKLEEHGLLRQVELHVIDSDTVVRTEKLAIEFFRTNHSIPDSLGVVVRTPQGNIVHTGDFKFDLTPVDRPADIIRMAEIGTEGVLALLSDSTNSERPGFTPSEKAVGNAIHGTFRRCEGRILFATFASNVHRLQQVVEAAEECGRRLAILGRSMEKAFRIGQELGYIRVPKGMLIDVKKLNEIPDQETVIVCTGSQGEPNAALSRIATGSHSHVQIHPGDTVIFSSSPIPGNTKNVYRSIDLLFRAGAHVIYGSIFDIHTSGHGSQEDLKLMLNLMKPTFFMPIHGEYRMLVRHAQLGEQLGIPHDHIFVLNNGQALRVSKKSAKSAGSVPSGEVLVNGKTMGEMESELIDDRKRLSESGVMMVMVVVDPELNKVLSGPDLISRGFVYIRESDDIMQRATKVVKRVVERLIKQGVTDRERWKAQISQALSAHFEVTLQRAPLILPVVIEATRSKVL
jgi:ribonuclease J